MTKKFTYSHNIANPEEFYTQVNNERDPFVVCFPTSFINWARLLTRVFDLPTGKNKTGGYKQLEDQYDWFMHNDRDVVRFTKQYKEKNAWAKEYDARELWEVEVYAFNKWVGRNVAKLCYNMTEADFAREIQRGRPVITTGKFCGFGHAVTVVGFKAAFSGITDCDLSLSGDNISIPENEFINDITTININDSYGNPNNNYKPVGKNGFNVSMDASEFFKAIDKRADGALNPVYYGIILDPRCV